VLSLVDSKFLTLKGPNEKLTIHNSLGMSSYRLILSLGFWKKLVYLTQADMSLDLCHKFFNKENFDIIYENFIDFDKIDGKMKAKFDELKSQMVYRNYYLVRNTIYNNEFVAVD
jgi:hypothetical protein